MSLEALQEHVPVLLREAVDALALGEGALAIDCTFGRGGHTRAILESIGTAGRLLAFDKDPQAVASPEAVLLSGDARFSLRHASYAGLGAEINSLGLSGQVDGILMDLGVSSPQLDQSSRGFSFSKDGPLDMRMDTSTGETAAEWLARVAERELALVLREYGEERFSGRIARLVCTKRQDQPILTTRQLAGIIEEAVPTRERGKHPATRSFQAIRILVNRELADLGASLQQALDILRPGGRLAVISFHSLEDRIVKRFMRDEERGCSAAHAQMLFPAPGEGRLKRVGKSVKPGEQEVARNPRARSAVLRVAEKVSV